MDLGCHEFAVPLWNICGRFQGAMMEHLSLELRKQLCVETNVMSSTSEIPRISDLEVQEMRRDTEGMVREEEENLESMVSWKPNSLSRREWSIMLTLLRGYMR